MRPRAFVLIGMSTLALTATAQMSNNLPHRKVLQRPTISPGERAFSSARRIGPQRTFSTTRFRQPSFSTARFRDPTFRTTRLQRHINTSFMDRSTNIATRRQMHPAFGNDWVRSSFNARPRPSSAFVNPSEIGDIAARREAHPASANDSRPWRLSERTRTNSSLLNPFARNDTSARDQTRTEFNDRRATSLYGTDARFFRKQVSRDNPHAWGTGP
jgi:hypothetical protein